MPDASKPLFVRLPADDADRLSAAAERSGQSKRHLVGAAVRRHLEDEGLVVGRASLREAPPEVLLPGEAAALLRVDEGALVRAAEDGSLPGRRIGDEWRFSRAALLDWLARSA
jgi:excisionase family DNA binding protein